MCGIVGYVGQRDVPAFLSDGLRRLEYRGYDSCGIAVMNGGAPQVVKAVGRIQSLADKLQTVSISSEGPMCGIGHTRWATHGRASEENAHPHRDCSGNFIVVHNGIIENHRELRRQLIAEGHRLHTTTDTEVIPHLIERHFKGNLEQAVVESLKHIEGILSIVV